MASKTNTFVVSLVAAAALACIDVGSIQSQRLPDAGGQRPLPDAGGPQDAMCAACSASQCTSPPDDDPNLVAGLELGCAVPEARNGRVTNWFTYASGASTASPAQTQTFLPSCLGANGSCYSACVNGYLFGSSNPYAGMGATFESNFGTYDLSPYQGVSFYVLGTVGPNSILRFEVSTVADASVANGGKCTSGGSCNDAYQIVLPGFDPGGMQTVSSNGWNSVTVTFDMLNQIGYGTPEAWDPVHALFLNWTISSSLETLPSDEQYTICVDQIELIPK